MGPSYHLHMNVGGKDAIAIVPTAGKHVDYMGKELRLSFSGSVCHIFSKEDEHNLEY